MPLRQFFYFCLNKVVTYADGLVTGFGFSIPPENGMFKRVIGRVVSGKLSLKPNTYSSVFLSTNTQLKNYAIYAYLARVLQVSFTSVRNNP